MHTLSTSWQRAMKFSQIEAWGHAPFSDQSFKNNLMKKKPTQCKIYPVSFKSTLCRIVGQKHIDVQHTLEFLLKITFSLIYFVFVESVSVHAPTLLWSQRTACSCHGFPSTMLVLWALIQVIRPGGSHLSLLSHLLCTEPFNIALLKPNSPWLAACPFLFLCQPLLTVISFLF